MFGTSKAASLLGFAEVAKLADALNSKEDGITYSTAGAKIFSAASDKPEYQ